MGKLGRKPRILVVDDEPEIVTMIRLAFEKEGYAVSEAASGVAALDMLGVEPPNEDARMPDVIILDIMMPVMDGFTVNNKLQENMRTRRLPVVILTARGHELRDLFAAAPNVAAYMQKPFDPKKLRELVAQVLEKQDRSG